MGDIRLIAIDLDGTLLNSRREIPVVFNDIVDTLYDHNIRCVAASGRQYQKLRAMFDRIKQKLYYFAENGGIVYDGDNRLYCSPIPDKTLIHLCEVCRAMGAPIVLSGVRSAYIESICPQDANEYYQERTYTDDPFKSAKEADDQIIKVAVYDPIDVGARCMQQLKVFEQSLKCALTSKHWIDITRSDVNKGVAMRIVQQSLGIDKSQCVAFGDYLNDKEMLQQSYYSYAMSNSHQDLFKVARFIAPSNDENGVIQVLEKQFKQLLTKEL